MSTQTRILFSAVVQIMGKPKEHITETMELVLKKLAADDRFSLKNKSVVDAQEVDDKPGFYSLFADVEVEVVALSNLYDFVFEYTPSSIQIISPETLDISQQVLSNALNDMSARMHQNDMYAAEQTSRVELLATDYAKMIQNALVLSLTTGPKNKETLAKSIGTEVGAVDKFLALLIEKKRIVQQGERYALP